MLEDRLDGVGSAEMRCAVASNMWESGRHGGMAA